MSSSKCSGNQFKAPLYEAMVAHQAKNPVSLHVPGHKSGQGLLDEGASFLGNVMSIDYTEITGLDDLHHAEGVIMEAERLAAACFGAEETHFLIGGSTVGNLAMILAVCEKDNVILVQRNVHKSVIHGLSLAGARAVFIAPSIDPVSGIATSVSIEAVKQALKQYPEARALFLTNPNYYGMGVTLAPFAELMHAQGKMLLVDEAHGAHYGFHPELPASALSQGADAVVQSTHKMLTAMTMGAMLHLQGPRINRSAVRRVLGMLQSSSPSYPIMASLDLARKRMHTEGGRWLTEGIALVKEFRSLLDEMNRFHYFPREFPLHSSQGYETADPFKVSIVDDTDALTATELKERLEAQDIYAEMTDGRHVLFVFTPASSRADVLRVAGALANICLDVPAQKKELQEPISNILKLPYYTQISSPIAFDMREISRGERTEEDFRKISVQDAIGQKSADMVIPYPPGIPYLYPGEVISATVAEALLQLASNGIKFQGTEFGQTHKLKVYT
ncbi:aminotransferase class I/II-fold pyridoxal phosphate-dependent enzyme [Paenibacillus aceris]|uniref:Arginine/lysine/ornithine decarboxylase n=1 Tax=Paenibacillus aceris TaxID=869555 RepID=A0ABS4I938_9BACL|nr:aminotransferase class I/II-fold pyridoxal phosphate-dependent enzyme [Paenibacillus aceris]MBP1967190.1 arginine/lysine/ornithine decarboxylase [Paenibacillus aceris]NHW36229.1 aminotransferase class I/II-fold pyridoxal phosphate-dependent enzyme [Paenibacillus aceris]